jgi:hypothetical protein
LGRQTYTSKKRSEVLASFADPEKGERELQLARKEGRFFYHPSFPGDESEAFLGRTRQQSIGTRVLLSPAYSS